MPHPEATADRPAITLHVVSSLDGFIAAKDNSVSWLESPPTAFPQGVPEDSAADAARAIDCFILGARTYEHALQLGWPYGDTPVAVLTHRDLPRPRSTVTFHSGDLNRLIKHSLAPHYRNIWLVGGAMLCQSFLNLGLVDEIRLSIAPVLLGEGLRLFGGCGVESRWRLKNVTAYNTGFVELLYTSATAAPPL